MICKRPTSGNNVIGPCPECGHAAEVHPGVLDHKGSMTSCLVCELQAMVEQHIGVVCHGCYCVVSDLELHAPNCAGVFPE